VPLVVWTFSIAHIAKFSETLANFNEEKPVGALILATQAVSNYLTSVEPNVDFFRSSMFSSNGLPVNLLKGPSNSLATTTVIKKILSYN
jgi:hypothetical protein